MFTAIGAQDNDHPARGTAALPPLSVQVANRTFNLDANVTLLRFYQFMPASVKPQVIAKILIKAIMQLPSQVGRRGRGGEGTGVRGLIRVAGRPPVAALL